MSVGQNKRAKVLGLPVVEERAKALIAKFDGAGDGCFSAVETEEMVALLRHALHHLGTLSAHAALHPMGRCSCHGEGRCQWCRMHAAQERVEALDLKLDDATSVLSICADGDVHAKQAARDCLRRLGDG